MRWVGALVLVGCSYDPARSPAAGDAQDDATIIDIDAASGDTCLGTGAFRICLPTPTTPFAVTGTTNTGIDTDASPAACTFYPQPDNRPSLCVFAATTITIDANVLVVGGTHPAVLFATETITINNGVDVGSHQTEQANGAGSNSTSCLTGAPAESANNGAGGGAGGSFGTAGGIGGTGDNGGSSGSTPGGPSAAAFLRGGCPGSEGGDAFASGGNGERGGGAILLLAGTSIAITGFVNASGAGGGNGNGFNGGGGGGGSGGMIVMSAPAISVTGNLLANGGGGGGGASDFNGSDGGDADRNNPAKPADGGGGGFSGVIKVGGDGAPGAAGSTVTGEIGEASSDGGGGGGGGLGVIRILSGQTIGGSSSPVPLLQ